MRAALLTTCLVDHLFPDVARSTAAVLQRVGVEVEWLSEQTCCGQLPFNDGFWPEARALAVRHLQVFERAEWIVAPSGSCVAMVRHFYPLLLADDPPRLEALRSVADRTFELSEFLVRRLGVTDLGAAFPSRVAYLASCHGYRGLGLYDEPLQLMRAVRGLELVPLEGVEECCGFGGAFSIKMAEVSAAMLRSKTAAIRRSNAEVVTGTDVSCLMHVAGGLRREGAPVKVMHLAEILAAHS